MNKVLISGILATVLLVAGCASTGDSPRSEQREALTSVVLQLATVRYFHMNPAKAEAAYRITNELIPLVETGEINTLDRLYAAAEERIEWDVLLPAERAALRDLLTIMRAEFEMQVGTQFDITPEQRERALKLLYAINLAASYEVVEE